MSSIVNKKFLFCLLLCETLSIFEVLANDKTAINVTGTLNINPTASVAATRLMLDNVGVVNVGNGTLDDASDPRAVLYLWHTNPNLGTDVNEIKGKLNIYQNGDLLNIRKIYIRPSSIANSAILTNNGLFANQGELVVGSGTTLICQKFPTIGSEEIKKRGGILNGCTNMKYTCAANDLESTEESYSLVECETSEGFSGIVTCVPGATINDGSSNNGEINGGIFSLIKYLGFTANNGIKYTSDDKYRTDNNITNTAKIDGQKLQVDLKNSIIELFKSSELTSKSIEVLDTGESDDDKKLVSMFSNLNFSNCTAAIPEVEADYKVNNLVVPFVSPTNGQGNIYLFKRNLNTNIFPITVTTSDNNFLQVRKLFDCNNNSIYYGRVNNNNIIKVTSYNDDDTINSILYDSSDENNNNVATIPNDGLLLTNSITSNTSFSDLFNKFINYNCCINVPNDTLYTTTNAENIGNYLNLQFNYFGTHTLNTPYIKDIYVQVLGNKDICISNSHIELENEEEVLKQYDNNLKLVLNNPWSTSENSYNGKLYRNLPDMNETILTIEAVRNTLFNNLSTDAILQELASYTYGFMKQTKYWNIVPQIYINDLNTYKNDFNNCLNYILNNSSITINQIVLLGNFIELHQQSSTNTSGQAEFISDYLKNNNLIQKISEYYTTQTETDYDNLSDEAKQQVLEAQETDFVNNYPNMLSNLSQYTLQFIQNNLDYDSLDANHKDYLESAENTNDDKLTYVLSNFPDIGKTLMVNYCLERKRQDYNNESKQNTSAVRGTQIYQNYDGPAFNNYKVNFINSHDSNGNEISNENETALKNDCAYCENVNYILNCNCSNFSAGTESNPLIVDELAVSNNITVNSNQESKCNILTQKLTINPGAVFTARGTVNVKKLKKADFVRHGLAYIK